MVRKRLEKEREAVRASQEEAAAARKAQEKERAEAQEALRRVMAELEREKTVRTNTRQPPHILQIVCPASPDIVFFLVCVCVCVCCCSCV